jgi:predicted MFS family arabinose efflux permease
MLRTLKKLTKPIRRDAEAVVQQKVQSMTITAFARHGLQLAAGALVGAGVVDEQGATLLVGAAMSVATAGWYFFEQRRSR